MSKRAFEKILLEAVDEALSSLGEPSKLAIYFHLEKSFNLKREEIPREIKTFARAIEKIFGLGSNFLEILIMKRLYEKIGGIFEWNEPTEFAFMEYVTAARRSFQERRVVEATAELVECEEVSL